MSTENNAHYVVSVAGAKFVHMENDASTVANAMGARSVSTANYAQHVANAAALRIANTCGLPARVKNAQCVIYVVPWVTLSTVDVFADAAPCIQKVQRARWTICVCAQENGARTSHERSCIRTVAYRRVKMIRVSTKSYRARRGICPMITSIVGTGSIHRCF